MPRTQSKNQGAGDTRVQIIRKIKAMIRANAWQPEINGDNLIDWIRSMDERAAKKAGGLGKK